MKYVYTQNLTQDGTASRSADPVIRKLFVAGCLIYTITKQAWSQTFLLALIEAGIMGITIGTAVIESLIDAALMGIAGI